MSDAGWPTLPEGWESDAATVAKFRKLLLAAQIDFAKSSLETVKDPPSGLDKDAAEVRLHETLGTLISGSIDRARDGAKFVETAAAALGTVYTGILAFTFAASGTHLPARGLYAAIFLGLAIVGSSFYLAFIQRIRPIGRVDYRGSPAEDQWRRTEYLAAWTRAVVDSRAWALRSAVFALAFGVIFMPAAFLPDRLADNPFLTAEAPPASPASPAATVWPDPPTGIAQPELAAVLYKAQLDKFAADSKTASSAAATTGPISADALAFALFTVGILVLVAVAAWNPLSDWGRRLRRRLLPR
jgi:hypothetical protein